MSRVEGGFRLALNIRGIPMNDSRRHFLAISAGAVAACAGLAVIALPAIANADPIFAAIEAHREAVIKFDAGHAKLTAEGLNDSNWQPVNTALSAQFATGHALIDTAPTTRAGLLALESYLIEDGIGPRMLRQSIRRPVTRNGITFTSMDGSPESVDWLISKRAAEIDQAG
jgi:hypothetical protein